MLLFAKYTQNRRRYLLRISTDLVKPISISTTRYPNSKYFLEIAASLDFGKILGQSKKPCVWVIEPAFSMGKVKMNQKVSRLTSNPGDLLLGPQL